MAKSEKMFTIKKAEKYLAEQGIGLGTQQVRNLARTNDIVMSGVQEYTDPISEETYKVITQSALDGYVAWKRANPDQARGAGRKSDGMKRYSQRYPVTEIDAINTLLTTNGHAPLEIPVPVKRGPRKAKNASATSENNSVSSDVDLNELELIEVA